MASRISNLALRNKCGNFIKADPVNEGLDELIQDALISSNREICDIDTVPLAWMRERYNELFTRAPANISAISQMSPCVVTAASADSGVTGHGYTSDDIVLLEGISGMDQLNMRLFRINKINATTFSLYQLNDQIAIDSSGYDEYSSGGKVYHCGIKIPNATIEPDGETADYNWDIKRVFGVTFDLYPSTPLAEEVLTTDARYLQSASRPVNWRYERYGYAGLDSSNEHYLMFNCLADSRYNIQLYIEKTYPDLATWDGTIYPPHPPEVHDCIWRRALSNLATNAEKQRRESKGGERIGQAIEVLYSQFWQRKAMEDEKFIKRLSRSMIGGQPSQGGRVRFNNPGLTHRASGLRAVRP